MPSNPFDQLGLKKQLVEYLHAQGKLDHFLKSYVRAAQPFIHPDKGGDEQLSAEVNSAYAELRRHPDRVASWIDSMQNGHSELEGIVQALVPELERLQGVEQEYAVVQVKYAQLLAGKAAEAPRRTAAASSRSASSSRTADAGVPPRRRATRGGAAAPPHPGEPAPSASAEYAGYVLMSRTSTYARGVEALRGAATSSHPTYVPAEGGSIIRPLTFKENIRALVDNYEKTHDAEGRERSMAKRTFLMTGRWKDSCTAVGHKQKSTTFKVVPQSPHLIAISPDFADPFIKARYSLLSGEELDSAKGIYNTPLTKAQTMVHPGWLAAMKGDATLLRTYANIVFAELKTRYRRDTGMGFYVRQNTDKDELRALYVDNLTDYSDAGGSNYLNLHGSFLRVAHRS